MMPNSSFNSKKPKPKSEPPKTDVGYFAPEYKEVRRKSGIPLWLVGVVWLIAMRSLPMYTLTGILTAAAASGVAYFISSKIFRGKKIQVEVPRAPKKTGNSELDAVIADGADYIARFKKANAAIADNTISTQIIRLESLTGKILDSVERNPSKTPQIRRFMSYYLPTTLKLLESYDSLSSQGISGENISATLRKIENIMGTIITAFENQLDSLYGAEALDIETDIVVLEGMIKSEGLAPDGFAGKGGK